MDETPPPSSSVGSTDPLLCSDSGSASASTSSTTRNAIPELPVAGSPAVPLPVPINQQTSQFRSPMGPIPSHPVSGNYISPSPFFNSFDLNRHGESNTIQSAPTTAPNPNPGGFASTSTDLTVTSSVVPRHCKRSTDPLLCSDSGPASSSTSPTSRNAVPELPVAGSSTVFPLASSIRQHSQFRTPAGLIPSHLVSGNYIPSAPFFNSFDLNSHGASNPIQSAPTTAANPNPGGSASTSTDLTVIRSVVPRNCNVPNTHPVRATSSGPFLNHIAPRPPNSSIGTNTSPTSEYPPLATFLGSSSKTKPPISSGSLVLRTNRLECSICFSRFSPHRQHRKPIVSNCGHTFCRRCAPRMGGTCATCRRYFYGEPNFVLVDALEELQGLKNQIKALRGRLRDAGQPVEEDDEGSESEESDSGTTASFHEVIVLEDDDEEPAQQLAHGRAVRDEEVIVINDDDDHPAIGGDDTGNDNQDARDADHAANVAADAVNGENDAGNEEEANAEPLERIDPLRLLRAHRYPTRLAIRRQQEEEARRREAQEEERQAEIRNDIVAQLQRRQEELVRHRQILDQHERDLFRALLGYIGQLNDALPPQNDLLNVD